MNEPAPLISKTDKSCSVILGGSYSRELARTWIELAPVGWVVTLNMEKRTLGQSDKFWTICGLLAQSNVEWDSERQTKQGWHDLLMHGWMIATHREIRLKPGLEGGMVSIGLTTRLMPKADMIELLDYAVAWATQRGIELAGD